MTKCALPRRQKSLKCALSSNLVVVVVVVAALAQKTKTGFAGKQTQFMEIKVDFLLKTHADLISSKHCCVYINTSPLWLNKHTQCYVFYYLLVV